MKMRKNGFIRVITSNDIETLTLVEIDAARVNHRDPQPPLLADGGPGLDVAAQEAHV